MWFSIKYYKNEGKKKLNYIKKDESLKIYNVLINYRYKMKIARNRIL